MLEFDEATHRYTYNSMWVPNVTSVTGRLESFGYANKDDLEYARARGVAVHKATELLDAGDLDYDSIDPAIKPYLDAYQQFKERSGFRMLCSEKQVYSKKHRFCGTLDRVAMTMGDYFSVIDIKTTAVLSPATAIQTAAYRQAYIEAEGQQTCRRFALHLLKNGTYKLQEYRDHAGDFSVFLSILNVYTWMVKHKLERPDDGKRTTRAIG